MKVGEHTPLVTIYITSYNYGKYIEQAIQSVVNQTLQDFELIIIDDGSTDDSKTIIRNYESFPNVTCIFQQNKGLNVTNNIAMKAATGKYIVRLDADDWLDTHALEVMSNVLERDDQIGLVFPDYYHVTEQGDLIEQVRRHEFADVSLLDQPAHGACTMIRRECLETLGGYDESFSCQDGYDLWIRFIEHYEVKNINLPLFYYRQHGSSLTRNEERILATRAEMVRRMTERQRVPLKVIAIIAVRGPNVDPHSSAMRPLGNKVLIDWTIEAAIGAGRVDKVFLTSPDDGLCEYVKKYESDKFTVIHRPLELAEANTSVLESLRHVISAVSLDERSFDAVMQLSIESPFRGSTHIDTAVHAMELFDTDIVIGVRPENDSFYRHNGHGLQPVSQTNRLRLERDDLYREVGSMRLLRKQEVMSENKDHIGRVGNIVIDQKASLRLVTKFDWLIAETFANSLN